MRLKKVLRSTVAGVLTIGVITALGILSVTGAAAALVNPGIGILIAAFIFGGGAEGEVFYKEIAGGIKDTFRLGKRGKQNLVMGALHVLLKQKKGQLPENSFLSEYQRLLKYLKAAKASTLSKNREERQRQEEAIQFAKQRRAFMEAYFTDRVMNGKAKADFEGGDPVTTEIMTALVAKRNTINYKMRFLRYLGLPISWMAGLPFALYAGSQLVPALLGTALLAPFAVMGWPILAMALVGGALFMFKALVEMVTGNWLSDWKARVKRWIKPQAQMTPSHVFKVALKSLFVAAVVGICVAGFIVTGSAMWYFVKDGAALMIRVNNAIAIVAHALSVVLSTTTFVFSLLSSIDSLHAVFNWVRETTPIRDIRGRFAELQGENQSNGLSYVAKSAVNGLIAFCRPLAKAVGWDGLRQQESLAQTLDPFRFVARTIQGVANILVVICHTVANGLGGNQSVLMSPKMATAVNASNELAQDFNFFVGGGDKKSLTSRLVTAIVSPLLFLSAGYQTLVSQVFNPLCNVQKPKLNFKQALKNAFELNKPEFDKPLPAFSSDLWRTSVIQSCFEKEEKRLASVSVDKTLAAQKTRVLAAVKDELITGQAASVVNNNVLNQHRLFASSKPTSTQQFVQKMRAHAARG